MLLIYISLILPVVTIFSCACWSSLCLLWKNIYLSLLFIFWLDCLGFFLFVFKFYWNIVDLQYVLVSGVQQSDSVIHIPTFISFSDPFLIKFITEYWVEFLVLYSRSLLVTILYMVLSVCNRKFLIYPSPRTFPLWLPCLFEKSVSLFLFHKYICIIF